MDYCLNVALSTLLRGSSVVRCIVEVTEVIFNIRQVLDNNRTRCKFSILRVVLVCQKHRMICPSKYHQ